MISLYILLVAAVLVIFGLVVIIFSHIKKIDRSMRMGRFFLVFGIIVMIISGLFMNTEKRAHQAAINHQEKVQSQQIYDAALVHISDETVYVKSGQAKVTIRTSENVAIKVHSNHEQLHDLNYKSTREKKNIKVTFVMPGEYTVTATRGQNKVIKHIVVLKDNHKNIHENSVN